VNITEFQYVIGRFRLWIEPEKIAHARASAALNTEPQAAIAVVFGEQLPDPLDCIFSDLDHGFPSLSIVNLD
jgi:hypothetical protein